jgi:uncharacterized protein YPO0396
MRSLFFVLILSTTTFGCSSKTAKETEPASDHAPTTTDKPATNHAVDDKATEDLQARQAEEAKVVDAKAATDVETVKAHAATQTQLQARFDASDRRFNELKEKISALPAEKKTKANAAVAEVKANEATVMAGIAKLRFATLPQWDAAKATVDVDSKALDKSIDALGMAM